MCVVFKSAKLRYVFDRKRSVCPEFHNAHTGQKSNTVLSLLTTDKKQGEILCQKAKLKADNNSVADYRKRRRKPYVPDIIHRNYRSSRSKRSKNNVVQSEWAEKIRYKAA